MDIGRTSIMPPAGPRKANGFSLVEMMIAITLGLLILAAVGSVFVGSKRAFRSHEAMGQIQESGRYATLLFVPFVRHAGYLPNPRGEAQLDPTQVFRNGLPLLGSDNGFFDAAVVGGGVNLSNVRVGTDALLVSYGGGNAAIAGALGGCGQNATEDDVVTSVFYVRNPNNTDPDGTLGPGALECVTHVAAGVISDAVSDPPALTGPVVFDTVPQPLISGVVDLQILYGIDTNPGDDRPAAPDPAGLFPTRFVPADEVAGLGANAWNRVAAVKIEITTQGDETTEGNETGAAITSAAGTDDDGSFEAQVNFVDDRRLQRGFSTTVLVRNRLQGD